MKIGNIVSDIEINLGPEYNYFDNIEDIDSGLPTLIIGYEFTKSLFGDVDMFNRCINGMFWTFTKKESRKFFNNDVEEFIEHVYKSTVKNVKYYYLDLIQERRSFTLIKKILAMSPFISFEYEDMIYMYNKDNNLIIGIDLFLIEYLGLSREKIKSKIKSRSSDFLVGNELIIEYINYIEKLDNKAKYIPFLYSIINHD